MVEVVVNGIEVVGMAGVSGRQVLRGEGVRVL